MARLPQPPRSLVLGVAVLLVVGVACYTALRLATQVPPPASPTGEEDDLINDPEPLDPRLTFQTVFRNVKPDVKYVGDASCTGCHGDICTAYHAHPMGRSAAYVGSASAIEKFDPGARNPFTVGGYALRVTRTADGVVHRVSIKDSAPGMLPEYTVAARLAIGSGTRGRSYLSVEKGAVWQSPLSWFSAESRWDLSPGFDLGTGGRRPITADCLFCHVDRVEPIPQTLNQYREPLSPVQVAIGCERCHGPGALHVAERSASRPAEKVDTSIVNPRHLPSELQTAICAQCHLQGQERVPRRGRDAYEFRPGLPFEQFVTVFVRHPDLADANRSVGQFEQLEQSRCTTASGGRLLCTSCHDPHATPAPASRDQFYRTRCNACHESNSKRCSAPQVDRQLQSDNCVSCHMPRVGSSNIAHASVTDHRIHRLPAPQPPPRGLQHGAAPLVAFRKGPHSPSDAELDRDLGVALARLAGRLPPGAAARQIVGQQSRDRLNLSLGVWRGDASAWVAMSLALSACGEADERLKAAENARRLRPESEAANVEVAEAALGVGRLDRAEEVAGQLVRMNPTSVDYLLLRATVWSAQERWERAEEDCRAALRIHPLHPQGRLVLAVCLHRRGNPSAGRKELETAIGLATLPRQKAAFRDWYQQETR